MGIAFRVQAEVGGLHGGADPGAFLPRARLGGAGGHHFRKTAVHADFKGCFSQHAEGSGRNMLIAWQKDGPLGGAPPQQRIPRVEPGEDAVGVGFQEAGRAEVAAHRQEAAGFGLSGIGEAGRGAETVKGHIAFQGRAGTLPGPYNGAMSEPLPPEPVSEPSRTFEAPKGFETKFREMPLQLDAFEGPLDLLLHLIREQKLEILDLPMAQVTRQYMDFLLLMEELNLEVAAEFVAMAAHLLQIKSRMMLPLPPKEDGSDEDPREALIQQLLDYQRVKEAARELAVRESEWQSVVYAKGLDITEHARVEEEPIKATLVDLLGAYREALKRLLPPPPVEVRTPPKTLDQRIAEVMGELGGGVWQPFSGLLMQVQTREDLVLTFLALLELVRTGRIRLVQSEAFGEIHVQAA